MVTEYMYSQSVHKDFHKVTSMIIQYIRENYGEKVLRSFFEQIAVVIYKPLIERINKNGLVEMKKHVERTFLLEEGEVKSVYKDNKLNFHVTKCPAITHMNDKGFKVDKDFCKMATEIVNKTIAQNCGYNFLVEFDQKNGRCVQKFWKEAK